MAALVSLMQRRFFCKLNGLTTSTRPLEALFGRGLSPQAVIHTAVTESSIWADNDRTVWENFVLLVALELKDHWIAGTKEFIGKALGKFLEYGADPYLQLSTGPRRLFSKEP